MKTISKISNLSVVCALCAFMASPANSAAPVRSLGGAGAYTSASGAAASKTSGTTSTRAGSLRVAPAASTRVVGSAASSSVNKTETGGSGVATSVRGGSTPRLSIGKYLSNKATLVGGSSSGSSGGVSGGVSGDFAEKVEGVEDSVVELKGRVDDLETSLNLYGDQVNGLDDALNALDNRVAGLEGMDVVSAEDLALVDAAVKDVLAMVEALPESLTKTEIEVLVSDLLTQSGVATQEGLQTLSNSLNTLATSMAEMEARVVLLEGIVSSLQTVTGDMGNRVAVVEGAVSDLESQIDVLSGAMSAYMERPVEGSADGYYLFQISGNGGQWLPIEFVSGSEQAGDSTDDLGGELAE